MPTLKEMAHCRIREAFEATEPAVLVIVVRSKNISRNQLIADTLSKFGHDADWPLRCLYVSNDTKVLRVMQRQLEVARPTKRHQRFNRDMQQLPPLCTFNYTRVNTLRHLRHQLRKGMLNLVVLDQHQAGEMDVLVGMVKKLQPQLTLIFTKTELPQGHAWEGFGEQLILSKPATTPRH